ncbi:MAG TPA: SRPBCC family protein [Vicinamibacteria bacterium]|jgi:uncharacterized protein YndB with AHSA1/START domain
MGKTSTDRIEKQIVLKARRSRVWKALTDSKEFGTWFRAEIQDAFRPGASARGRVLYPGYEHLTFEIEIERMEPERLFSYRWHPYAVDPKVDYSKEPTTLVVFELEEIPEGTLLKVTESGFDRIPVARRDEAYRMNSGGWEEQVKNISRYLSDRGEAK